MTYQFFVGCYGDATQDTLFSCSFDEDTHSVQVCFSHSGLVNASYLLCNGTVLYAVSERPAEEKSAVAVFSVEENGLQEKQRLCFSEGGACHLMFDPHSSRLFVACYDTGTDAVFAVKPDGRLAESPSLFHHRGQNPSHPRQTMPHAHGNSMTCSPYRMASVDLGADLVTVNNIGTAGDRTLLRECSRLELPKGSGPRHIVFSKMELAYLVTELSNEILRLDFHAGSGSLWSLNKAPTLPTDFTGESTAAAIKLSPDERHLAVSNRGHDSIMIYDIEADGSLTNGVCTGVGGLSPRDFSFSPDGKYLFVCCEKSDLLLVHSFDEKSNRLTPIASLNIPSPACVILP